ncbi:MAG: type II secretion system F family protein [Pyrinomonadaceae bacterium]|nr:type II secretion system F family protein [Phycisphaerales bacterium]
MPTFKYQSLSPTSGAASVIDAPDRASAVRQLRDKGITPAKLEEVGSGRAAKLAAHKAAAQHVKAGGVAGSAPAAGGRFALKSAMSRSEMASFIRELSTAIEAGLPLVQALKTIARSGRSPKQKAMLGHLIHEVESGRSMGDAAAAWGKPFSDLTVDLIRAGEASGQLGEVLSQSATLLDKDVKLRRSLLSATMYPLILTGLVSIAVVVVVTFIVPKVLGPLAGQLKGGSMPLPTRVVQGGAAFVKSYWWLVIGALAAVGFISSKVYASPGPRLAIDRFLLKVPVLGRLLRDVAVARFTRTLGTLVSAGIPALSALRLTKNTLGNVAMEREIDFVCDEVSHGKTIADPMERSGYFPPLLVQIVGVGERSGRLPQMLNQAATAFEDRTETSVKLFTTALPPVLVVVLACIVGFVVAAILLPLLELQEHIG